MTKKRFKVLKYWLTRNRNNVGFKDLVKFFFAPSYSRKAKLLIASTETADDYVIVYLKGLEHPLFYPKNMDLLLLREVLVELFYEDNWHYYQINETRLKPNDIVLDCGGAEGAFSLIASSICKKCYVIEPLPEFISSLSMTFRTIDNVEILPCALSDRPGTGTLQMQGIQSSLSVDCASGMTVKIETIDNLFFEKNIPVNYIKADLEGNDLRAIIGATKTINKYKPRIAITTYHHFDHARQIADCIKKIDPRYNIKLKGIYHETGSPVMLHAWVDGF